MRKRRIRDIVIELTSLLDVVMILIFAVMIENSNMVKASEAETEAAKATIEEMQTELDGADEEKQRIEDEYARRLLVSESDLKAAENELENKDKKLAEKDKELEDKETELKMAEEIKNRALADKDAKLADKDAELADKDKALSEKEQELQNAKTSIAQLLDEKSAVSKELAVAQKKLEEGSVEDLLARLANAESKIKGYEYLSKLIVSYNVGCKCVYEKEEDEFPIYRTLNYGKAGTDAEDRWAEFRDDEGRNTALEAMKAALKKSIDAALAADATSVYVFFNYDTDMITTGDRKAVENALNDLISKYDARVLYKPIKDADR
jgi:DNA repair exonuclease SbcCD ATPase subunit